MLPSLNNAPMESPATLRDPNSPWRRLLRMLGSAAIGMGAELVAYAAGTLHDKARERRSLTEGMTPRLRDVVLGITAYTDQFRADMYSHLADCVGAALAGGYDLHAPAGHYQIGDFNFPLRNTAVTPTELLDCGGITLYGDGPTTVFSTYSPDGADVFQLRAVKKLTLRNFVIEPVLTATAGSGSNGISITSGYDDIVIEGVVVRNAPGIDKGSFIDGGKALTVQNGTTGLPCGRLRARITAVGCAEGFGTDVDLVAMASKGASIDLRITADRCYRAFKFSAGAATGALSASMESGIVARVLAVNCQQDVVLARAHGVTVEATIVTSVDAATRRQSPAGTAWAASDTIVEALRCEYAHRARLRIRGDKGACDYKARLGGTTAGSSGLSGATKGCSIDLDVGGTAAIADVLEINSGGNTMRETELAASDVTASSLPLAFYSAALKNRLRIGVVSSGSFTATLSGCTTSPTGTVTWSMNGDVVTLQIPEITGVSNSSAASLSGMPDTLKPATLQTDEGPTINNGTYGPGLIQVANTGVIVLCASMNPASTSGFTTSGTKGVGSTTITYRRS